MTVVHPEHAAVATARRAMYRESDAAIGYVVESLDIGDLVPSGTAFGPRLFLDVEDPGEVAAALASLADRLAGDELHVWVDSRERAVVLEAALVAAGARVEKSTTYLTLVGPVAAVVPAGLDVVEVDGDESLARWCSVKVRAFADDEAAATASRLESEWANQASHRAVSRYLIGRLEGEDVAVVGWYPGRDALVYSLGTLVAVRHRGIGRGLLARVVAEESAARSLSITCDDPGRPAELYRSIGFVDETYWLRRYRWSSPRQAT